MAIKWVRAALEHSLARGGALCVLLALADRADDEGVCWPSQADIAAGARLGSLAHVRRLLRQLQKLRELAIEPGGGRSASGRGIPSTYRLLLPVPPNEPPESRRSKLKARLIAREAEQRHAEPVRRRTGLPVRTRTGLPVRRRASYPCAGAQNTRAPAHNIPVRRRTKNHQCEPSEEVVNVEPAATTTVFVSPEAAAEEQRLREAMARAYERAKQAAASEGASEGATP